MIDIDYYRKIQNMADSTDIRTSQRYEIQENLNRDFAETLDFDIVKINGIEQDLTIIETDNLDIKKIKSRPNECFFSGDIIEWLDSHWLITEVDTDNKIICYGKMQECNYLLKWQDTEGNIISRWVINQNSSSYSNGTEGNKTMVVGSDQHLLLIPLDEETKRLQRDKRVMIFEDGCEPMVYKLTRPDSSSYVKKGHGYLSDILIEDALNIQTDRVDLKLCDYIEKSVPPTLPTDTVVMKLPCENTDIKPSKTKTLTAQLYQDGIAVAKDIYYQWSVSSNIGKYITYSAKNNVFVITLSKDCEEFGETITISVMSKYTGQSATVNLTVKEVF